MGRAKRQPTASILPRKRCLDQMLSNLPKELVAASCIWRLLLRPYKQCSDVSACVAMSGAFSITSHKTQSTEVDLLNRYSTSCEDTYLLLSADYHSPGKCGSVQACTPAKPVRRLITSKHVGFRCLTRTSWPDWSCTAPLAQAKHTLLHGVQSLSARVQRFERFTCLVFSFAVQVVGTRQVQ